MARRYFEFIGGTSAKFYEVGTIGTEVTVRYGRLGTAGQTQIKTFPNAAKAAKHAEKLVAEKLGKGYVEREAF